MLVISVFPRETLFTYIRSRLCDDVEVQPREKKENGSKERGKKKKKDAMSRHAEFASQRR